MKAFKGKTLILNRTGKPEYDEFAILGLSKILLESKTRTKEADWFTSTTPEIYPLSATLEDMKRHCPELNFEGIRLVDVEVTVKE